MMHGRKNTKRHIPVIHELTLRKYAIKFDLFEVPVNKIEIRVSYPAEFVCAYYSLRGEKC